MILRCAIARVMKAKRPFGAHVCFTPKTGVRADIPGPPVWAISGSDLQVAIKLECFGPAGYALALRDVGLASRRELEAENVVAFGDRSLRLHLEALIGDVIVAVAQLALLDVENKAAVDAAHREQHALRSTFRHVGVHRNRMRHLIRASWSYPLPCRLAAEDGYRSSLISTIRFWEPRTEV